MNKKLIFILALGIIAAADGLFFGVTLTNAAGNVIGATNPAQTAGLAAAGLGLAGLGTALGLALGGRGGGTVVRRPMYRRPKYRRHRYRYRGKRAIPNNLDANKIEEDMFEIIASSDPADCFRKIICEISTGDDSMKNHSLTSIMNLFEVPEDLEANTSPEFKAFKYNLAIANKVGAEIKNLQFCSSVFECPIHSDGLDYLIKQMQ